MSYKNSVDTHVYLPKESSYGVPKIAIYVYYYVLKQENWFTLGLNTAKNTDYIKKSFKLNLLRIKFPTKNSAGAHVYLP